ncbi:carbohydrate ABC transporter permease [Brachybacterium sp. NBEC-018]|uniref:carbohydrate ABC transporter permease n=1 Tax=Brachybacterium sp. NBEC-018 TaxID=2996004 RepID=UPI0021756277|nr:carbohydrate ABC transporter permease [Brachybacterium sp. NBEC-018]UVY84541.1 carbohydrate ABC transporter permease [Brachybacterium sp. NBEC-018]
MTDAPAPRPRAARGPRNIDAYVVLTVGGLVMIFPFVWQLIMSLSTQAEVTGVPPSLLPASPQWGNFAAVFDLLPFVDQFLVSVGVTALRVIVQMILCAMAGYAFARMQFRGRGILFALLLSILMVPNQIYLIPQYSIIQGMGLLNTVLGIAMPGLFSAFGTFLLRQHFVALPAELEEAARLDGANPWQIFWRVMLPLSGPALASVAILTTIASWNDLLWPLVVSTYEDRMPLAVGLATLQGQHMTNYPVMMAASLLAMAPILILFLVLQRRVVEGLAHSGMKG